jgi:hypothetical protein
LSHHPNTTLAVAAGVQQSRLNCNVTTGQILLVVGQIKAKDRVGIAIRQRHQIGTPNVEVSVKVGDPHSFGTTDSHDRFKGCCCSQRLFEVVFKARSIFFSIEHDIGAHGTSRHLGEFTESCQIHVLVRKEEHVDADLLSTEFHSSILVPRVFRVRLEQRRFFGCTHDTRLLTRTERTVSEVRLYGLEDTHLASDLLGDGKGCLECRSETRATLHRILGEHFR